MKRACVVGCGGIGSYFAQHIDKLIDLGQIKNWDFQFFDDDVVEKKNIFYQNFQTSDIDSPKSDALSMTYFNVSFNNRRIKLDDLKGYDLIILCADNNIIRREALKAWKEWQIPFIDSRANGKTIGIFSSDTEKYEKTIDNSNESHSCQNPFQIAKQEIEFGNVVIAAALAQTVLEFTRKKRLPDDFIKSF